MGSMEAGERGSAAPQGDVVQTSVGDYGLWQLRMCLLLCLTRIPSAWHQANIVYLAPPTNFTCDDGGLVVAEDPCLNQLSDEAGNLTSILKCSSWKYDRSVFEETMLTQWDMVCGREQLVTLAQSTLMFGNMFGDVIFGIAADRFGRKSPLLVAIVLLVLCGAASALVPHLEVFLLFRFFTGFAVGGTMVTSFVLSMESVGGKWRMITANLYHIPFGVGFTSLSLLAYFIRDWRVLQLAISLPCICLITYYCLVPESARWLVAAGHYDDAVHVIKMAATANKLQPPPEDLILRLKEMNTKEAGKEKPRTTALLLTSRLRMRTLCLCVNWFVNGFSFFGITQLLGRVGSDPFLPVAVAGLLTIPGKFVAFLTLDRYGRRATMIASLALAGLGSLSVAAVTSAAGPPWARTAATLCGVVGLSVSLPTVYLFTVELMPTVLRNNGVGFASMFARLGCVAAPVAVALGSVDSVLPPLLFGVAPFIGVAFSWPLPETAHKRLPHSIEDVENPQQEETTTKTGVINQTFTSEATYL